MARIVKKNKATSVIAGTSTTYYATTSNASSSDTGVDTSIEQYEEEDYDEYENDVDDDDEDSYSIIGDGSVRSFAALTNNITGIFGIPYQWSPYVDRPVSTSGSSMSTHVGRKYSEKILSTMPILFLTPGTAKFMADTPSDAVSRLGNKLASVLDGADSIDDDIAEKGDYRYYSFQTDFEEYRYYANMSCKAVLFYLGLKDINIPIPGSGKYVKGKNFDITSFMSNSFTKLFGSKQTLPFYVDAETSISEDFSNSTTESMLSQTANGFSSTARELQFIMGDESSRSKLTKTIGDLSNTITQNLGSAFGDFGDALAGKNMITRVANEITTIVKGGKIIFPEIWSDSSYSRSYNVNLKFRSPDPDPVSIFLNVYMPILLLIDMAAPRQLNNSANSYESPFLVRATYKSIFTCDMGIIESISITRGGDERWNVMGMPVSADVSLSIKDLYGSMFISRGMGLINNTIQMDYLATLAGVDLNEFEVTRIYRLAEMIIESTITSIPTRAWGGIKQSANRAVASVLSKIGIDTRTLRGY